MSLRTVAALLLFAFATALVAGSAAAQESGGVVVTSSPTGAVVELLGDHEYSGVTPWRLNRGLSGSYEIHASMDGYTDWFGATTLSAVRRDSLHVRLTKKSPMAIGLRSAICPGWGQFYSGHNLKGTVFLLAEVGAISGVLYADGKREDAMRIHDRAIREYNSADQVEDIEEAYEKVLDAFDDVDRWHENRKRWIYTAAVIWIANVVDAAVLIPSESGGGLLAGLPDAEGSGVFAGVHADKTVLGYSVSF